MTRAVTTEDFRERVLESDGPIVVDFYADWCGPCKGMARVVEQLSNEWEGRVEFVKVDIEADPQLASAYNISSVPALLLFDNGEVHGWSTGAKPGYVVERELRLKKRAGKGSEGSGRRGGLFARRLRRGPNP